MYNGVIIFGREIPLYGLFFFSGIVLAALISIPLAKRRNFYFFDIAASASYAMIGSIIGAKLLFIAVSWKEIVELHLSLVSVIKGGFVFYGGLFGGALGVLIYVMLYKINSEIFDIFAVVLPLGHALGRVGCYCAGCCYGIPYDGFPSVIYDNTVGMTPTGTSLLAIQLIEAAGLLLLFTIQMSVFLFFYKKGRTVLIYLIAYPNMRFFLEFFRGDTERGVFFGCSTSQWVSLLIIIATVAYLLTVRKIKIYLSKKKQMSSSI